MDKLHREHEFVKKLWNLMRESGMKSERNEAFWSDLQEKCEKLSEEYKDLTFADTWMISYMKYLEGAR